VTQTEISITMKLRY